MSSARQGTSPSRRALSGVAVLALTGAVLAPVGAAATDDAFVAPGSPAPESKIHENQVTGAEVVPDTYFVQLAGPSTVDGGSLASIQSSRESFLSDVAESGAQVEVRSEFDTLWNGLSVQASESSLLELAASDAVEAIFPVGVIDAPEQPQDTQIDPELFTAISMTGADIVQSELGYTGAGVKVGIIDTGIDYDHPDFGGNGSPESTAFPTEKVAFGYDFVGDDYNADPGAGEAYQPKPFPDADPDDCQGHGTHVAGITGADGEVTGVAPGVTLGAYRVFGCEGSTDADIMLHAMEQTLTDEMDVVNLSIGSAFSAWQEYPTAQATDALAREGVVVVASIGNSGANGLHSVGAPGVGDDTIGVGSVDNTMYMANFFLDEEGNEVPYTVGTPAPAPPTSGDTNVVAVAAPGTTEAQACGADPFTAEQKAVIDGNWVLIQRGTCSFHEKARNGQAAGAAGVMLYNNVGGSINPSVAGDPAIEVPVVMVTQADGTRLAQDALATDGHTVTWTDGETSVPNPTGGLMSSFSSIGTTADMTFKPDLSAPGGQIYATYPLEIQPYATLSGTSMASPHVAGAAALMLEANPDLGVEEIKLKLQNSSIQLPLNIAPAAGLELVHRQGTGMIQIDDAILAETHIEPGLVQLGQQLGGETTTQTVTVTNTSDTEQVFTTEHETALATSGTGNDWGYYYADADVAVAPSVVVPAGASVEIPMTITSPTFGGEDGLLDPIFGGYVHFTAGEGEEAQTYTVAYGGSAYDLQDVEVLADMVDADGNTTVELPALGVVAECGIYLGYECYDPNGSYDLVEEGYVYSMEQDDAPQFLVHFEHQARKMEWEVFAAGDDGTKGESLGTVAEVDYLARSATRNGFSAYPWDGMVMDENGAKVRVADGDYILEIVVTKASAWNDDREALTETWTSPVFGIAFEGYGEVDRPGVERTLGQDRYSTASELAVEEFPNGVDTVFIASGLQFPDALAGGALAGSVEAPVLLTKVDSLPAATRMALQQLGPDNIVVLGGTEAVNADVATALAEYGDVERIEGANRYATAAGVSQALGSSDVVFLASGLDYPDALAAAAAAGMEDAPVLLTKADALPSATAAELERLAPDTVYVVGGETAVSGDVAEAAGAHAGEVVRLGGENRYDTAGMVAMEFFPTPAPGAFLATGVEFPDALAAAPVAAMNTMPVLLTKPDRLTNDTAQALMELRAQNIHIVGGYDAVAVEIQEALEDMVYP